MTKLHRILNRPEDLRPVGTRFIHEVIHDAAWTSTDTNGTGPVWWEYEVVGHVLTPDWPSQANWIWQEKCQPIVRVYEPAGGS